MTHERAERLADRPRTSPAGLRSVLLAPLPLPGRARVLAACASALARADLPPALRDHLGEIVRRSSRRNPQDARDFEASLQRLSGMTAAGAAAEGVLADLSPIGAITRQVNRAGFAVLAFPAPLRALVVRVVRRARLWPAERADLARELAAHFRDGLDSGAAAEELASDFGDADETARLIRAAWRRKRPAAWRALRTCLRLSGAVLLLFVIVYAAQAVRLWVDRPQIKRDFWSELNAPLRDTPLEQRAWPLYQQAQALVGESRPLRESDFEAMSEAERERVFAWLAQHEAALRLIREAAARPVMGVEYLPVEGQAGGMAANPPLLSLLLPHLEAVRNSSTMLLFDVERAVASGDAARLAANFDALFQMIAQTEPEPFLISKLVHVSLVGRASFSVGRLLRDRPDALSDGLLATLAHRLSALGGPEGLRVPIEVESTWFEDVLQRCYTDNGRGGGAFSPWAWDGFLGAAPFGFEPKPTKPGWLAGLAGPGVSLVVAGRSEMRSRYEQMMNLCVEDSRRPMWLRERLAGEQAIQELSDSAYLRNRFFPLWLLFPSLSRAAVMGDYVSQERDGVLTALAVELHRREHGAWPESLDELVPHRLPRVPIDRYDGGPIKYRLTPGGPVIYSIGVDRKDDGGRLPEGRDPVRRAREWRPPAQVGAVHEPSDIVEGDWILWPPPRLPPRAAESEVPDPDAQ